MKKNFKQIIGSITIIALTSGFVYSNATTITTSAATVSAATVGEVEAASSISQNAIYFTKPADWGESVNAYIYKSGVSATWPGTAMTKGSDGIYSIEVPENLKDALVIFNDGVGKHQVPASQTPGAAIKLGQLFKDGAFVAYNPTDTTTDTKPDTKPDTKTDTTTDTTTAIQPPTAKVQPSIDKVDVVYNADKTVTFKVNATGGEVGNNKLFFKFIELDASGKEIKINQDNKVGQNYSLSNVYKTSAPTTASHKVKVLVQNSNNESVSKVAEAAVKVVDPIDPAKPTDSVTPGTKDPVTPGTKDPVTPGTKDPVTPGTEDPVNPNTTKPLSAVSLTSSASTVEVGTKVKITAKATGGQGTLYYQFNIAETGWASIGNETINPTLDWTPTKAGTYYFYVIVKDKNNDSTKDTRTNSGKITIVVKEKATSDVKTPGTDNNPATVSTSTDKQKDNNPTVPTFDNNSLLPIMVMMALAGSTLLVGYKKNRNTNN